jgi:hypothetical protein
MTEYTWADLRERAIRAFGGQTPRAGDEEAILGIWQKQPAMIARMVGDVAAAVDRGEVTWGWSALRARAEKGARPAPEPTPFDDGATEQRAAVERAKTWIRRAGCEFPNEAEIVDELFGVRGRLRDFADNAAVVEEILGEYREVRPAAIAREEEREQEAARWREARAARRQPKRSATTEDLVEALRDTEANPLL